MRTIFFGLVFLCCASWSFSQDTLSVRNYCEGEVLDFAEVEPMFPDGYQALSDFIKSSTVYPEEAIQNREQGTVYVRFVVNVDGSICNIEVMKGVSPNLDKEAVRVVSIMPKWIPAEQGGKLVRCAYQVPIKFVLSR